MPELRDAIDFYHSLLDDETGNESQGSAHQPAPPQAAILRRTPAVHRAAAALPDRRPVPAAQAGDPRGDARLRQRSTRRRWKTPYSARQFRLADWEEDLVQVDPGFSTSSPTARMDTFFTPEPDTAPPEGAERGFSSPNTTPKPRQPSPTTIRSPRCSSPCP